MKNRSSWILTLLLVVLPIISYFFLNQGSKFFRSNYSELTPKGELPEFIAEQKDDEGALIWNREDSSYLLLLGLNYGGNDEENLAVVQSLIQKFHESFVEDRNGISSPLQMVLLVEENLMPSTTWKESGVDSYCRMKSISQQQSREIALSLGIISKESDSRNFMALVDRVGRVRQLYLNFQENTLSDLYRHMAILIPPAARKDIIFKRDKEL